jgi:hypothetical protein
MMALLMQGFASPDTLVLISWQQPISLGHRSQRKYLHTQPSHLLGANVIISENFSAKKIVAQCGKTDIFYLGHCCLIRNIPLSVALAKY